MRLELALVVIAIVATCGCGGAAAAGASPAEAEAIPIPDDPGQLLPGECFGGIFLDVATLRSSFLYERHGDELFAELTPNERRYVQEVIRRTDRVVIGTAWGLGGPREEADSVIVLRGRYPRQELSALLSSISEDPALRELQGVHPPKPSAGGQFDRFFSAHGEVGLILGDETLVLGVRWLVERVVEGLGTSGSHFVDGALYRRLRGNLSHEDAAVMAVVQFPDDVSRLTGGRELRGPVSVDDVAVGLEAAAFALRLGDRVDAELLLETTSRGHSERLVGNFRNARFLLKALAGDPDVSRVLGDIQIRAEQATVRSSVELSRGEAERLVGRLVAL